MADDHQHDHKTEPFRIWTAFGVFVAVIAILLAYEHRAHLLTGDVLLYGLLAACVGVHLFMHGGHGGHRSGGHGGHDRNKGDEGDKQ